MTTAQDRRTPLGEATLAELAQAVHGDLLAPGADGYDDARSIWNGAHDRRPALIVRCSGVADVIKAVEFARSENLPLAVRGGGHSIPRFSTCDGGLVLDCASMKGIRVDPHRKRVDAQPGCLWQDLDLGRKPETRERRATHWRRMPTSRDRHQRILPDPQSTNATEPVGVRNGEDRGLLDRSTIPAGPSSRSRSAHRFVAVGET